MGWWVSLSACQARAPLPAYWMQLAQSEHECNDEAPSMSASPTLSLPCGCMDPTSSLHCRTSVSLTRTNLPTRCAIESGPCARLLTALASEDLKSRRGGDQVSWQYYVLPEMTR